MEILFKQSNRKTPGLNPSPSAILCWKVISASAVLIDGSASFTPSGLDYLLFSDGYYTQEVSEQFAINAGFFDSPTIGYFAYYEGLGIYYFNGTVYKLLRPDLYGQVLTLNQRDYRRYVLISSPAFIGGFPVSTWSRIA